MKSIRELVFETNSSSAHSLTIARKSLYEKLKNWEAFYVGDYKWFSDMDETFVNVLEETPEKVLSREELYNRMTDYLKSEKCKWDDKEEILSQIKPELITKENYYDDSYAIQGLFNALNVTVSSRLFGEESTDDHCMEEFKYDLKDGDELLIRHVEIAC